MEPSPTQPTARRDPDSGRVAVPEIAELLHLQRPAAAVAAAAVVLLGLLVTLVAPGLLPTNAVTGVAVGVLALLAAVATAVLLDGRDPMLRGPRHLRRDGHTVLARMAGPDVVQHGGPVLAALERRLEGREHLGVVLTGDGCDPSKLAATLGRAAAAAGHTSLVIDLRAPGAPGVADVGEGTVRLGEAARLADDRPYAWIGAGVDRDAAASAAAGVARRPPRDLALLLVVAPDAATRVPEVLQACDRTVLLVAADTQQRAMVTARLNALERAGARPEAVVVGGVRAGADQPSAIDAGAAAPAGEQPTAPTAPTAADPVGAPQPAVPPSPAPPPTVPDPPAPDEPAPITDPEPVAPPIQVPPEAAAPEAGGERDDPDLADVADGPDLADVADGPDLADVADEPDLAAGPDSTDTPDTTGSAGPAGARRSPADDTGPLPPVFRTAAPAATAAPSDPAAPAATAAPSDPAAPAATAAPSDPAAPAATAAPSEAAAPSERDAATDVPATADQRETVAAPIGDTEVEGMAQADALMTIAALDQLVADRHRQRDVG